MRGYRKWKALICGMLAALMMLGAPLAMASTGDRTLMQTDSDSFTEYLEQVIVIGTKVYLYLSGSDAAFHVYDTQTGETEVYDLKELNEGLTGRDGDSLRTEDGDRYTEQVAAWFSWKGEIYAVLYRSISQEDVNDIDGGFVRKLILAEGKASLEETDVPQLEWGDMTERNGASRYNRWINSSACVGNRFAALVYGDSGDMELHLFDLETGRAETAEIDDLLDMTQGPEGKLLIGRIDRRGDSHLSVELYDPEEEESQVLAAFPPEEADRVRGIAWREENNTLYYIYNGEVYATADGTMESAESVNECGLTPYNLFSQITADGFLAVYRYDGALLRNVDPSQRGTVTIRIHPYAWSNGANAAYYAFSELRGDIGVIREDSGDESTLLQSMMNQDDRVDIYTISGASSVYSALYNRGFMGSLESSEKLKSLIGTMYPFVQEACKKDGTLVAVPISMTGDAFGYNTEAWEKLGFTETDLPRTWDQFLDLLESLPQKTEGTEYRIFELWVTKQNFRSELLGRILQNYAQLRPDDPFNTPVLQRLLGRAETLDLDALGLIEEDESEEIYERYTELGGDKSALLIPGMDASLESYRQEYQTLLLTYEEGEEPVLPVTLGLAFLNPFSQHPEEAIAYLETTAEKLDTVTAYSFYPDRNDPVRYPDHEEQKRNMARWIDDTKARLEETEDEDTRENLEKTLEALEKELAEFDETYWLLSPTCIAHYRDRAPYMQPAGYDFWSMLYGGENGETFSTLWNGYLEGQKSAQELLSYVDQKVRMMRMEGN